jgi:hypothetical protein
MNERMLLDEWKYYQRKGECNWLLKRTLMNDNTRTAEEKKQFYYDNRRIRWYYSDFFKEQAEKVELYCDSIHGCFDNEVEEEYYLDNRYLNDGYDFMDYGHNQRVFNMYRRYNDLRYHANDKVDVHLSFEPIKNAKFREHKTITLYRSDIKFIRNVRKYNDLTVTQIEVLFGIIFFCRMHESEKANLDTLFKLKQFLGCFDNATMEDFEYVVSTVYRLDKTEDNDIWYHGYYDWHIEDEHGEWIGSSDPIWIPVTKQNNKLNLTKMARKYITDLTDKKYCEMCLKPFKPANNRQKVCEHCKPKADAIKAKLRKNKQRFIQKNGKDACCGKCTDCIRTDCNNWWEYWWDEILGSRPEFKHDMTDEEFSNMIDNMLHDIKNVYTEEEKSIILPYDIRYNYKKYSPYR